MSSGRCSLNQNSDQLYLQRLDLVSDMFGSLLK